MRFGLLYEHQLPHPWIETSERELFEQAIEQVELADRLGIDYIWEVEHHFLEDVAAAMARKPRMAPLPLDRIPVIAPLGRNIVETADSAGGLTQHQHAAITVPLEDPVSPR